MATYLTKTEFFKATKGRQIDVDGVPKSQPYQCVDYNKYYMKKCFGVPYFSINNYAKNYYEQYEQFDYLKKYFVKIKNTATFIPEKGDICVWGSSKGSGCGHVAVADGTGTTKYFYSYDQNWGEYSVIRVKHDYSGFLGVLRPKYKCVSENLNVRNKATSKGEIVDELEKGTLVYVYETSGKWSRIGENKWVASKYLD